jgi:hypothetical protein
MDAILASLAPFIDAVKNFSVDTLLTGNLGNVFSLAVAILAVVGLVECLFGYPLLRIELVLAGLAAGMYVGDLLLGIEGIAALMTEAWMPWVLKGILGILIAFIAYKLFRVALFCAVGLTVFMFGRGIIAQFLTNGTLSLIVSIVAALLIALIALKLLKTVIMILTSFTGAFCVTYAVAGFLPIPHINLILLGLLFIVGVAVQIRVSKKD